MVRHQVAHAALHLQFETSLVSSDTSALTHCSFLPFSYIVITIYALGLLYSLPRFFEYETEVQRETLTIGDNLTELFEHLVVTNKLLDNHLYHYIVHLSTILTLHFDAQDA
jgi:hypothetical protein